MWYLLRLRLHVDDQSKNGEMCSDSTPSFTLVVLQAEANGMWAWRFHASAHPSTCSYARSQEPAKDMLFFFDGCSFRAHASIVYEG